MILDCPSCQVSFQFDESLFQGKARRVRCNQCGYIWRVQPTKRKRFTPAVDVDQETPRRVGIFGRFLSLLFSLSVLVLIAAAGIAILYIFLPELYDEVWPYLRGGWEMLGTYLAEWHIDGSSLPDWLPLRNYFS